MSSFRRLYSTATTTATATVTSTARRRFYQNFDKSMYYPIFLTVIFGSQLINLMNKQRDYETLERKYQLKISKIEEIMNMIKEQGVENVDVAKELELVNRLFKNGNDASLTVSKKTHEESMLSSAEDDIKEEDLLKMLGLNDQTSKKSTITAITTTTTTANTSQNKQEQLPKLSEMNVSEQIAFEKELQNYRVKTENHTIVEIPGDYVDAAKDTKIKKFL